MARDVISQMQDKVGGVLEVDEHYIGAQALTIKSRRALSAWAEEADLDGALPNLVRQHGSVDDLAVADQTIPNAFLAAVTPRRVLLFSRSITGRPRELIEEHDLVATTMDFVDTGDRARSRLFVFGMPSGMVFAGECPINGKAQDAADRFVQAWTEAENLSVN